MASPRTCPAWCAWPDECRGDHADHKAFIGATGTGQPIDVTPEAGARFPAVGVGLDLAEEDGWHEPALVLWLVGVDGKDPDIYLRPAEARAVVEELQQRLALLEAAERG